MRKNRVKEFREAKGISQEHLARECGVGRSTISELEAGKHVPSVYLAIDIATVLCVTIEVLFVIEK